MINVLFFAKLREELQVSHMEIESTDEMCTIADVVNAIGLQHGANFLQKLSEPQVVTACNHEVAPWSQGVKDGDELAFYPPVSGG